LYLKFILIGLLTGTLIGTVGVGGILLTPLLVFFTAADLHIAQATSSFSFLFTGIVGTFIYSRQKSIDWNQVLWISLGIIPTAILGANLNTRLSSSSLSLILAVLIVFAGINALVKRNRNTKSSASLHRAVLSIIGVCVGFGSSLTGTGGPVFLVPILLMFQFLPLFAVGISQAVQLPIAIFATIGFSLFGSIDYRLGLLLGVIQGLGVILGGKIAHSLPQEKLRQVVAVTLVGVGFLMIVRGI